jgi:hypothetical protein
MPSWLANNLKSGTTKKFGIMEIHLTPEQERRIQAVIRRGAYDSVVLIPNFLRFLRKFFAAHLEPHCFQFVICSYRSITFCSPVNLPSMISLS